MSGFLVIAPTQRVLDILSEVMRANQIQGNVYVKLIGKDRPTKIPASITLVDDAEILQAKSLKVLCCSEEAIYWLAHNKGPEWTLQFFPSYLGMLDKLSFKEFAMNHRLPICLYWTAAVDITEFPVVGKPSIGFASMGVQYLGSDEECQQYEDNFSSVMAASVVEKYRRTYFPDVNNTPVFEREIRGDFFRTSFVVQNRKCTECFPVKGVTQSDVPERMYSWIEFEYTHRKNSVYASTISMLDRLTDAFALSDGVYVAEFIGTPAGELYLLEFSPRITSQRIANLIHYATGVDLERGMVYLFLGLDFSVKPCCRKTVRLRIERTTDSFAPMGDDYVMYPVNMETSAHGDSVICKYYVKTGG